MITNIDGFYAVAKKFQDERHKLVNEYEKKKSSLESYKGSDGYNEDIEALNEKFNRELKAIQTDARKELKTFVTGMRNSIDSRKMTPPTSEQLNLISLLKMRESLTIEEIDAAAVTLRDNDVALGVLSELAKANGFIKTYSNGSMTSYHARRIVDGLDNSIDDFISFDSTKASRTIKTRNNRLYGSSLNGATKRDLFDSIEGCFCELGQSFGSDELRQFAEIVNNNQEVAENADTIS